VIADIKGRGHVVAGLVTGRPHHQIYVSCEGDVRVYIDGIGTPQVESDGSESWACYGWGFPEHAETNPTSGYDGDGMPHCQFSMTRVCTGDWYPFQSGLRFGIEAGDANDCPMRHSGLLLYYGLDGTGMRLTDEVDIGDQTSESAHRYRIEGQVAEGWLEAYYEGNDDDQLIKDYGRWMKGSSEFIVTVDPTNEGVRLRRRCDQNYGQLRAFVSVDGSRVQERSWYQADRNQYKRWLDDEFEIPAAYTSGKGLITVRIEYAGSGQSPPWNEFHYWVFSHLKKAPN